MNTEGFSKPTSNIVKFGKVGDAVKGYYEGFKEVESKYGGMTKIYQLRGISGSYHDIIDDKVADTPTEVVPDAALAIFAKNTFADDIERAKINQQVIVRYEEERTSKANGKKYKFLVALLGPIDEDHGFAKPSNSGDGSEAAQPF